MIELLLELLNVTVIPYIAGIPIRLYPMWKTRDVKSRTILIIYCCYMLSMCAGFLAVKTFWTVDFRSIQLYKAFMGLPSTIIPFWIFRDRVWQNVFLTAVSMMLAPLYVGIGMYAGVNWFADAAYPLLGANIVSLAIIAVMLPPLLFILRRLHENFDARQTGIWRFIWILPMSYFGLFMLTGNFMDPGAFKGNAFFIIRALLYGALLLTCYLLETAMRQVSENVTLKENARMTERQLNLQREQYERLMGNVESAKAMRHDIRHQLAVLKGFGAAGDLDGLNRYIDELTGSLPVLERLYCKNYAVNAVINHHLSAAGSEDIRLDIKLDIPEKTGRLPGMDLCVVVGNFLENAAEACRRMEHGEKFIRVRSLIQGDYLTLTVENSFDGLWNERDGAYLSRKREGAGSEGVGLPSVKTVCAKYDGRAVFAVNGNVWRSSAVMAMENGSGADE